MSVEIRYTDGTTEVVPGRVRSCKDGILAINKRPDATMLQDGDLLHVVLASVRSWRES